MQFEWAWQHPTESLVVREAASKFKSFSGIANKVKLAFTMLTLPSWQRYYAFSVLYVISYVCVCALYVCITHFQIRSVLSVENHLFQLVAYFYRKLVMLIFFNFFC